MDDANIRIAELESILTNCLDDHTPEEIAEFEQELHELQRMEEGFVPNEYTLDFIPNKLQPLRKSCYISAHCNCPNDYKVSYTFNYACNEISIEVTKNDVSVFSKMYYPRTETPFRPLSLHEVELIVTKKVVDHVLSTKDWNLENPILSRLRPWDKHESVRKPGKSPRYVFLEENENKLLLVSDDTNTYHYGYLPKMIPKVLGNKYEVTTVADIPYKLTHCQIVFVVKINHDTGGDA